MYVTSVHLTVTRHSDYFVRKDTSECVARCYDDTVHKKWVNYCVLKHLFWNTSKLGGRWAYEKVALLDGSCANQKVAKKIRKCFLRRATNVTFLEFRGSRRKKNHRLETALRALLIHSFIRINSGPHIMRSCFLHWAGFCQIAFHLPLLPFPC